MAAWTGASPAELDWRGQLAAAGSGRVTGGVGRSGASTHKVEVRQDDSRRLAIEREERRQTRKVQMRVNEARGCGAGVGGRSAVATRSFRRSTGAVVQRAGLQCARQEVILSGCFSGGGG